MVGATDDELADVGVDVGVMTKVLVEVVVEGVVEQLCATSGQAHLNAPGTIRHKWVQPPLFRLHG